MNKRSAFLIRSLSAAERKMGRLMRAPDGHAEATPAPAEPASEPAEQVSGEEDDFSAFERSLEGEEQVSGDVKPATPEEDDATNPDNPPEPEEKQGASAQERIDELTAARREAERQAAAAQRELAELRAANQAPAQEQPSQQEAAPNPDDYEFGEADSKFIADSAKYHARAEWHALQQEQAIKTEVTAMETKWNASIEQPEFKEKYPDFAEKVTQAADRGEWHCSPLMALMIKGSDAGPDVAYHLATNPAESKRIAELHPYEQALEIGRLEGRMQSSPKPQPQAKTVTEAPEPPLGRTRGAGGRFSTADDTDDFAAFEAKADGILAKK